MPVGMCSHSCQLYSLISNCWRIQWPREGGEMARSRSAEVIAPGLRGLTRRLLTSAGVSLGPSRGWIVWQKGELCNIYVFLPHFNPKLRFPIKYFISQKGKITLLRKSIHLWGLMIPGTKPDNNNDCYNKQIRLFKEFLGRITTALINDEMWLNLTKEEEEDGFDNLLARSF